MPLKMYILVKDNIDLGHAILAVAHGAVACYKKFIDDPHMKKWSDESFRKVVCRLNEKEFEAAKAFDKIVVMTESALDGKETAIVLCPRPDEEYNKAVKWYKLYDILVVDWDNADALLLAYNRISALDIKLFSNKAITEEDKHLLTSTKNILYIMIDNMYAQNPEKWEKKILGKKNL